MTADLLVDVRYVLAVIMAVTAPTVIVFWLTIHGGIGIWRDRPLWQAYTAALAAILLALGLVVTNLDLAVGADLGTHPAVLVSGLALYGVSMALSRRVRKHLDLRTFAGVPQVKGEANALIDTGPFAVVRHPRYLVVVVATLGWMLAANHAGSYGVAALFILALLGIIRLEERDLIVRFGESYADYRSSTPMLIPEPRQLRQLFV